MYQKKHLSFNSLRKIISRRVLQIKDPRQEAKVDHVIHDCCLSAFAMMYFQDPSMLEFQTRLQEDLHINNLKTLLSSRPVSSSKQFLKRLRLRLAARGYYISKVTPQCLLVGPSPSQNRACAIHAHGSS